MIPYTYLIGWSKLNVWYYGVRYANSCNPNDLWKTYFTSSVYVRDFRNIHGEPDVIEVRKLFSEKQKAQLWEAKVLKRLKVLEKDEWLNKTDCSSIKETPEMRSKIWESRRKNGTDKQTFEQIQKRLETKRKNGTTGKGISKPVSQVKKRLKTLEEKGFGGWKNSSTHGENVKQARIKQGTWGKNNMKKTWETRRANQLKKSSNVDNFSAFQPMIDVIEINGSKKDF